METRVFPNCIEVSRGQRRGPRHGSKPGPRVQKDPSWETRLPPATDGQRHIRRSHTLPRSPTPLDTKAHRGLRQNMPQAEAEMKTRALPGTTGQSGGQCRGL
ncbi:hypothetical protein NDU88_002293 [Pleurodeles waltl]|uniref:Uncharacterized protein n=1 Tax=Pleurodeles waltl TaxID=8319 RepID=A0AAV7LC53_PLEWA|nr:hypothetical protein NDU88_002293 [Pleurodeles waltl]